MIEILAKQAVEIKCGFENAKLTGNYECAYALGVISGYADVPMQASFDSLSVLKENVISAVSDIKPENEKISHLISLVREYEPKENMDEQMKNLYMKGLTDKNL